MVSGSDILARLFAPRADAHGAVRPLWHRVVELARAEAWYRGGGIADTLAGRFDAVTLVLALVLLRMERGDAAQPAPGQPALAIPSARLTELFVEDMDGQLRQSGVGDLVVGKHIGRLMGVLGGRLGALREVLGLCPPVADGGAHGEDSFENLAMLVQRNVTLRQDAGPEPAARLALALAQLLAGLSDEALLAGAIPLPEAFLPTVLPAGHRP